MSVRVWLTIGALTVAVPCAAQDPPANPASPPAQIPTVTPTPPDFPRGRISGYVFGDYYYNVVGDPSHRYSAAGLDSAKVNIDNSSAQQIGRDLSGFQIRRAYFQLDNDLSIKYSSRFRLEADGRSLASDGKVGVAIKDAYLQVKSVYPRADLFLGLIPTPIWQNSDEFWGYRSIEKTIADFRGLGGSADMGASVKGWIDAGHHVGYLAMIGNGLGQRPEDNRYKKFYFSLPIRAGDLRFEPFADYEHGANGADRVTYKAFAGYEFPRATAVGVEFVDRVNHRRGAPNQEPRGLSVFARSAPRPTLAAFARFDLWQSDVRTPNRVDSQLWIVGLDWQPFRDVHFMPNLEATQYDARGTAVAPPRHDLQARLTIYYRYSRPQS